MYKEIFDLLKACPNWSLRYSHNMDKFVIERKAVNGKLSRVATGQDPVELYDSISRWIDLNDPGDDQHATDSLT